MESIEKFRKAFEKEARIANFIVMSMLDDIEAEIERDYMKLPVDADGVPIHVGDDMASAMQRGIVTSVNEKAFFINHSTVGCNIKKFHHVKPRTLEDVLRDFINEPFMWDGNREYEIAESEHNEKTIRRYADEIRELLGGDER